MCTFTIQIPDAVLPLVMHGAECSGMTAEQYLSEKLTRSLEDWDDEATFARLEAECPNGGGSIGEEATELLIRELKKKVGLE